MNNPEVFELLAYMATSAAGLKGEPKIYGPLRLIESCQKLVSIILQEDANNENLKELIWIIESGKHKSMTDEDGFYAMLDAVTEKLVDCL